MIRPNVNGRVITGLFKHLAKSVVHGMPVIVNSADVGVVLFLVKEGMRFIQEVPQFVLKPVGPPIVSGKHVPAVLTHQVPIDFGLVFELGEQLVENPVHLSFRIDLCDVKLVGPKPGFDFLKQ